MKRIHINYKIVTVIILVSVFLLMNFLLESDLTEKQAMVAIFGNYDDDNHTSLWKNMNFPEKATDDFFASKTGIVNTIFFQSYKEHGRKKFFLVTKTIPTDIYFQCHACLPLISAATFSRAKGEWKIESQNLFITYEGEYGESPKVELIRVGQDRFAARMEYEHRFDMLLETEIALLIPYQDRVENAYEQVIYFDNFSGCGWGAQCASYKAEVTFDTSTKDGFYNIKIAKFGTDIDHTQGHMAVPVKETAIYQFNNGKYVQISWKGYRKIKYNSLDN